MQAAIDDDWTLHSEQRSKMMKNGNDGDGESQSFCVRVPDDDDVFEHDDVYENSPYMDQARHIREMRMNALTEDQKRWGWNMFTLLVTLFIAAASYFVYGDTLFPGEKDSMYYFQMGFNEELSKDLDEAFMEWDADLDSAVLPVFWNVPLSGGDIVEDVVASCLHLVQANEVGGLVKEGYAKNLEIVQVFGDSYVNVDTTTKDGIHHASALHLAGSGLADVVFTPMVYEPAELFQPYEEGYAGYYFTILRHPIERAVHMFYYLKEATWDPLYTTEFKTMSIEKYANSPYVESNWLTRILTNHTGGTLTEEHVNTAKEVLRRKFLVGVFSDMEFSVKRFEKRFGWYAGDEETDVCVHKTINEKMKNYNEIPMVEEGSLSWNLLLRRNKMDMEVYEFAQLLFLNQKSKEHGSL